MTTFQHLALAAEDILPLSMVALLSFSLGMIVTILFVMARGSSSRPDLENDFFEDEEEASYQEDNPEATDEHPAEAPKKDLWEKDPDWWKD